MARRARAGTRVPIRTATRAVKFVDKANWDHYHRRWREIDAELPLLFDLESLTDGSQDVIRDLRENARAALRAEMRAVVSTGRAMYLIPV